VGGEDALKGERGILWKGLGGTCMLADRRKFG